MNRILKRLEEQSVVSFEIAKGEKTMNVSECCDNHFDIILSKREVRQLIAELMELYKQMK